MSYDLEGLEQSSGNRKLLAQIVMPLNMKRLFEVGATEQVYLYKIYLLNSYFDATMTTAMVHLNLF